MKQDLEDTYKKQEFLRNSILNPGYDANAFVDFLGLKKENGTELEYWTLEELKEVVDEFIFKQNNPKLTYKKNKNNNKNNYDNKNKSNNINNNNNNNNKNNNNINNNNKINTNNINNNNNITNINNNNKVEEEWSDDEEEDIKENYPSKKKCSLDEHSDIDAVYICQECKINMCNKCQKVHSGLLKNHHIYAIDQNEKDIFTGLCTKSNHSMELEYYCKTHNQLCCASCIAKINLDGKGQHKDCEIYYITKIKDEKKKNLSKNIKNLEKLSQSLEPTIKQLKSLYEKVIEKKERLKEEILNIFTKIRNELNNREDKLLAEIDKKADELFIKEKIIKKIEKLPNLVKISLEKGNIKDKEWKDEKNLKRLIHNCINIEKNIKKINKINNILQYNNFEFKFIPPKDKIESGIIKTVKSFGDLEIKKYTN